ncbi:uncharacterized protein BX663DRAFT_524662 [Cokeromyces recurvatus]|uniref:uncharacterized protein n=1 Tax=Cokeromyces recurvatus TaxID=90255 RepID=UPI002220D434|nr:uncharacterized protein BX663DRAFT_524662 [Cokeromyces recurvatus]KAI7898580.1 hypothetical protein BX663DRAFT_524662 [Cokeromyces recurvatus]
MMTSKFVNYVLFPATTIGLIGTVMVRSKASPSKAHTQFMKSNDVNTQNHQQWKQLNDGLGVNDVGRSCGGV